MTGPPPRPWNTRANTRNVRLGAMPESNELTVNRTVQIRKKRRRPSSPESQPVAGMMIAFAARKDVDPRHLLDARRERALHVWQGHVRHARVEDLHHGHEHDRDGDQPLPCGGQGGCWSGVHECATRVGGLRQVPPGCVHRTRIVTMTDIPARSVCGLPNSRESRRIFTGTRWTTLTQFPVAFSGGSSENRAPVPAESELTMPVKARSGTPSTQTSARMPGRILATWVSLKFASTQTSWSGTIARSGWPIWTTCPTSTERFETTPSIGVRTSVYWSWSSAKARSACVSRSRASACVAAASLIATWWSWLSARASAARASATRCLA